jgi:hypothetical protein
MPTDPEPLSWLEDDDELDELLALSEKLVLPKSPCEVPPLSPPQELPLLPPQSAEPDELEEPKKDPNPDVPLSFVDDPPQRLDDGAS